MPVHGMRVRQEESGTHTVLRHTYTTTSPFLFLPEEA